MRKCLLWLWRQAQTARHCFQRLGVGPDPPRRMEVGTWHRWALQTFSSSKAPVCKVCHLWFKLYISGHSVAYHRSIWNCSKLFRKGIAERHQKDTGGLVGVLSYLRCLLRGLALWWAQIEIPGGFCFTPPSQNALGQIQPLPGLFKWKYSCAFSSVLWCILSDSQNWLIYAF